MSPQLPICFEAPLDPEAEVTTDAQAARVRARIEELWARAEVRWQEGGRPLRYIGCSYYVVDSNQASDRSVYLSQAEADEVHALSLRCSLYVNDPYRAHERVLARLARLAQRRAQRPAARKIHPF